VVRRNGIMRGMVTDGFMSEPELGTPLEHVEVSLRSAAVQDAVPVVELDPPVLFRIPGDGAGQPRHPSPIDGAICEIDVRVPSDTSHAPIPACPKPNGERGTNLLT
jgi:hypothetical protein